MSERDYILARIREALAVTAPAPGHAGLSDSAPGGLPDAADHRRVLPPVGLSLAEQLSLFQKNAAELRADFRLVKDCGMNWPRG